MLVFLAYVVLQSVMQARGPEGENPLDRMPAVKALTDIDHYERKIFPDTPLKIEIEDIEEGRGPEAGCGQEIMAKIRGSRFDGANFDPDHDENKPVTFRIGAGKTRKAWEEGIAGMRVGGTRKISAPPEWVYANPEDYPSDHGSVLFHVTLLSAAPLPKEDGLPFAIIPKDEGEGDAALCGEVLDAAVLRFDAKGERIPFFDTPEPQALRPGDADLPIGLSRGLVGLKPGGKRVLLIPPEWAGNHETMLLLEVSRPITPSEPL